MGHRSEAYGNTNYLTVAIFKFRPMTQDIGVERGWAHGPSAGLAQSRGHLKKPVPSRAGSRSRDPARDRGIQIVHPQQQESKN